MTATRILLAVAFSLTALCSDRLSAQTPPPLPALKLDQSETTVSGISSGAYMAVQLHVAYSSRFSKGVAAIAGGPYDCAAGSVMNALVRCLGTMSIPADTLIATARQRDKEGVIDSIANIRKSRVYIFNGGKDSVVKPVVGIALRDFYLPFVSPDAMVLKQDVPAEHAFVTDNHGAACEVKDVPFINNCGFDLAGALLAHLYGPLNKPDVQARGDKPAGTLHVVAQADASLPSLAEQALVYIPAECAGGTTCRLHVALHGCRQNAVTIGESFARNAGYNRWADANRLVILYPQTGKAAVNACWDWWGYTGADYARRGAKQMTAILATMDRLTGAPAAK